VPEEAVLLVGVAAPLPRSLGNRRFRLLLLGLLGLPLLGAHVLQTLVEPLLDPSFKAPDFLVYLHAARDLAAGRDPYQAFFTASIPDATLNQAYIYPPLLAWLLHPLAGLSDHAAQLVALAALQLCLLAFLAAMAWTLRARSLESVGLMALLVISFYPTRLNFYGAQVNLLLLALSGLWLAAWVRGDAWWGGAALGFGVAVKILQLPLVPLLALGRRWRALCAAALAGLAATLVAAPALLPEYWLRVFPSFGLGTGFRENLAPAGALTRLLEPSTFYGQASATPGAVRLLAALAAAAVVAITAWHLRLPRQGRRGRTLEAAAAVAATPLLATLAWPSHLVLLLLPILVLLWTAAETGDARLLAMAASSWLLLGPVHSAFLYLIAAGVTSEAVLRPLAETGLAGILLLWVASLLALRRHGREAGGERERLPRPGPYNPHSVWQSRQS
jgi:hypothetical protein